MNTHQPPPEIHSARLLQDGIAKGLASTLPIPLAANAEIDRTLLLGLGMEATCHSRSVTACLEIKQAAGNAPCNTDSAFYHFNKLDAEKTLAWFHQNNQLILTQAKARGAIRARTWYAIDDKRKPFYGKPDMYTTNGQKKAGTNQAYGITTAESLHPRQRFTTALEPCLPLQAPASRLKSVIEQTKKHGNPRGFLIDAGFFGVDNLKVLRETEARFVLGAPTTDRIWALWREHHRSAIQTKNGHEMAEHVLVIPGHKVIKNKNEREEVTLILLHRDVYTRKGVESQLHAWVTNVTTDPKAAAGLVERYRERWGIETGYRSKNEAHAYTASNNPVIRLWLILLSVLLYNWWRLVDWSRRTRGAQFAKPEVMYYVFRELLLRDGILAA